MSAPENPPAFPVNMDVMADQQGMTLRDWFAGQALNAFVAAAADNNLALDGQPTLADTAAHQAYRLADAMLAARSATTCHSESASVGRGVGR